MKAALIPPKGYHETAKRSDYHLMLPLVNPDYTRMYAYMDDDHYIILDNGAAEGNAISDDELIGSAIAIGVDEVVAPDVMRDMPATIARVDAFMDTVAKELPDSTNIMLVVQGTTMEQVVDCIKYYMTKYSESVLGIPRHLLSTLGDPCARYDVLATIERHYGKSVPVHLLGTNVIWPNEVAQIASSFPWVRGVDSSIPYNYAIAGTSLPTWYNNAKRIQRPEGYFTQDFEIDTQLLDKNIQTFIGWANGTEGTPR